MFKFVSTKNNIELFHRAILSNDLSRTKLILEEAMKDPRFDIDEINEEGLTALQFSCFAGHLDTVKVLVSFKANTKKRDRDGNTLLHAAVLGGKSEVVKYLLRCGGTGSIKPVVRNDDNLMPIDMTDEIAIIVILLRSMLDQGYLEEMQEYMLDHPKLKRNINEELRRVKCQETEKNEILRELPYSSHTSPRRQKLNNRRSSTDDLLGRSISTFSKLSTSMQYIDQIATEDKNNNYNQHYHQQPQQHQPQHYDAAPSLRRHDSTGSNSSHGSRSSRSSKGSSSMMARNEANNSNSRSEYENSHRQTQKYLENRFPTQHQPQQQQRHHNKPASYEHAAVVNNRNYSDGYISDSYDDRVPIMNHKGGSSSGRVSRSSSISSHSSNHTGVFSDTCSNFDFPQQQQQDIPQRTQSPSSTSLQDEQIYQNFAQPHHQPPHRTNSLPTITEGENIYENLPLVRNNSSASMLNKAPKYVAPPLPPRQPIAPNSNARVTPQQHQNNYQQQPTSYNNRTSYNGSNEYDTIDHHHQTPSSSTTTSNGSETDSGIDINETIAGRVFALSLDEQREAMLYSEKSSSHHQHDSSETNHSNTHSNRSKPPPPARPAMPPAAAPNSLETSYSKPIGIYYSEQMNQTTVRRSDSACDTRDDTVLLNTANTSSKQHQLMMNPKYRSWNGRTLLESQQQDNSLAPYSSHHTRGRQRGGGSASRSRDDYDIYRPEQQQYTNTHAQAPPYHYQQQQHEDVVSRRHTAGAVELRQFNFDHQPEIML